MIAVSPPPVTVAATVLALNFRHAFYPLSFPIRVILPGIRGAYSIYAMIDEAYATYVLMPPEKLTSTRMPVAYTHLDVYKRQA